MYLYLYRIKDFVKTSCLDSVVNNKGWFKYYGKSLWFGKPEALKYILTVFLCILRSQNLADNGPVITPYNHIR